MQSQQYYERSLLSTIKQWEGDFVPLSDFHNSVSESGAKTMQTGQTNKHYRQVLFTQAFWRTHKPHWDQHFCYFSILLILCVCMDFFDLPKLCVLLEHILTDRTSADALYVLKYLFFYFPHLPTQVTLTLFFFSNLIHLVCFQWP